MLHRFLTLNFEDTILPVSLASLQAVLAARTSPSATRGKSRNLTERQRQALELAADGATNEDIASRLSVSVTTVETTLRRLSDTLGAKNRANLIALAMREHLID